jgi:hypothetical protein
MIDISRFTRGTRRRAMRYAAGMLRGLRAEINEELDNYDKGGIAGVIGSLAQKGLSALGGGAGAALGRVRGRGISGAAGSMPQQGGGSSGSSAGKPAPITLKIDATPAALELLDRLLLIEVAPTTEMMG